jgi:hypothetical protein
MVIKPRVSNERLLRAGGVASGVSIGLMGVSAIAVFAFLAIKNRVNSFSPDPLPAGSTPHYPNNIRSPAILKKRYTFCNVNRYCCMVYCSMSAYTEIICPCTTLQAQY